MSLGKIPTGYQWVYKIIYKADGSIECYDAQLVALASTHNWFLQQLDVNNSFLHGDLKEEVCMVILQALHVYVEDLILTSNYLEGIIVVKTQLETALCIKDLGNLRCFLGLEVARSSPKVVTTPMVQLQNFHDFSASASTDCTDFCIPFISPAILYCDSQSVRQIVDNLTFDERTKHIDIDCHVVHEKLQARLFHLQPVPSASQLADILTKPWNFNYFIISCPRLSVTFQFFVSLVTTLVIAPWKRGEYDGDASNMAKTSFNFGSLLPLTTSRGRHNSLSNGIMGP
ncbi:uncharacterized protein [Cicer arietinum]|uniref:uncharacterized protein n=1 Tax=Cicer arietinum TaxID=3827 RepID=UPI003CC562A9